MLSSTLKALVIHTSDDAGIYGPDYQYGWGVMNTKKAADLITKDTDYGLSTQVKHYIQELELTNTVRSYSINLHSDGTQPLKITIAWTDVPGTVDQFKSLNPRGKKLVNDLDIRLTGTYNLYPWTLDPNNPSYAALRGDNNTDNVEQIYFAQPPAGDYIVTVNFKNNLDNNSQKFAMIITGAELPLNNPILSVSPSALNLQPNSGSSEISVSNIGTGTMNWTARTSDPWITLTNTAGSNSGKVTFNYQENSASTERHGTIIIEAPNAIYSPIIIDVIQKPQDNTKYWVTQVNESGSVFGDNNIDNMYMWNIWGYWMKLILSYPVQYETKYPNVNFKAHTGFISGTTQKFNYWSEGLENTTINTFKNWDEFTTLDKYDAPVIFSLTAKFLSSFDATIYIKLDGVPVTGSFVYFKDPWLRDDSSSSKGTRNRGAGALFTEQYPTPLNLTTTSKFSGVFLNQTEKDPGITYMVKAEPYLSLLNTTSSFMWWSSENADVINPMFFETPVVFRSNNSKVFANYKGSLRSNTPTAFSNTSQRKFVRTDNGYLHLVYESMNHIWYERSTDNGSSWQIMNDGKFLDQGAIESKLPSIAAIYDDIAIVWQERNDKWGSGIEPIYSIKLARFDENSICRLVSVIYDGYYETCYELTPHYSTNADPVVAFNVQKKVLVCWKSELPESPENSGISYKFGAIYISPDLNGTNQERWYQSGMIPGTTINSYTPTVTAASSTATGPYSRTSFAVAWEARGYQSSIVFLEMLYEPETVTYNEAEWDYVMYSGSPVTVSNWNYCQLHSKPSLALIPSSSEGEKLELGWVGERIYYENGVEKREKSAFYRRNAFSNITLNWSWDATTWHWYYGNVRNVNVNTSAADGIIGWNEESGVCRYVRTSNIFGTRTFSLYGSPLSGQGIQVNNGSDLNTVYGMTLNTSAPPYYFKKSAPVSSLGKTGGEELSSRTAIARLDSAAFYISSSRLSLDGKRLGFTSKCDSIKSYDAKSISEVISTVAFTPMANSTISYDIEYGALDTLYSMKALSKGEVIQCRLELQDGANGSTLKVLDRFSLDKLTMKGKEGSFRSISGSMDVRKFAGRNLRLKLVIEDGINARWGLMERVLGPEEEKEIKKIIPEKVVDYALNQNYPNPFNPSTLISYEIPNVSKVTLKVYDMLGKEVSTLVDEVKGEGKYSVEFNASSLPSGIYIYEIRANDFVKSGKMMFLK